MECNLEAYKKAYGTLSYAECADGKYEPEYEKVAIYIDREGKPTHAARQLSSGRWTSKLGQHVDIDHETLEALEGPTYGTVAVFMKRRIT